MDEVIAFEVSRNVFADLALPNAEELFAKAHLALSVSEILRERRLNKKATAGFLRIVGREASRFLNGQLMQISTERLMHFLLLLGRDVEIVISVPANAYTQGTLRVTTA